MTNSPLPSIPATLADLLARARAAHSNVVLVPVAAVEAAEDRHSAQSLAAHLTNARRIAKSGAMVWTALLAVLQENPTLPRHNLVAKIETWLPKNWPLKDKNGDEQKVTLSKTTIAARLDELVPREVRGTKDKS